MKFECSKITLLLLSVALICDVAFGCFCSRNKDASPSQLPNRLVDLNRPQDQTRHARRPPLPTTVEASEDIEDPVFPIRPKPSDIELSSLKGKDTDTLSVADSMNDRSTFGSTKLNEKLEKMGQLTYIEIKEMLGIILYRYCAKTKGNCPQMMLQFPHMQNLFMTVASPKDIQVVSYKNHVENKLVDEYVVVHREGAKFAMYGTKLNHNYELPPSICSALFTLYPDIIHEDSAKAVNAAWDKHKSFKNLGNLLGEDSLFSSFGIVIQILQDKLQTVGIPMSDQHHRLSAVSHYLAKLRLNQSPDFPPLELPK